jgi:hypothetical protein
MSLNTQIGESTHPPSLELTEDNYAQWASKASAYLKYKSQGQYVLGKESCYQYNDEGEATALPSKEDKGKLSQAMGLLELLVGSKSSHLIDEFKKINENSVCENDPWWFWCHLKEQMSGKSSSREAFLRTELTLLTFTNPKHAIAKIRDIQRNLNAIGAKPVPDESLKNALLDSLEDSEYDFVIAILRLDKNQNYEAATAVLKEEHRRISLKQKKIVRKSKREDTDAQKGVFHTSFAKERTEKESQESKPYERRMKCSTCGKFHRPPCRRNMKTDTPYNENLRCFNCNQRGHFARSCKENQNDQSRPNTKEATNLSVVCQICKQRDHTADKCRFRYHNSRNAPRQQIRGTQNYATHAQDSNQSRTGAKTSDDSKDSGSDEEGNSTCTTNTQYENHRLNKLKVPV